MSTWFVYGRMRLQLERPGGMDIQNLSPLLEAKTAAFLEFPAEVGPKRGNGETPNLVVGRNGNRVQATLGSVTTTYIGNHFEWRGSTSTMTRYYYADGQRIAMRQGSSTLCFLLGDHGHAAHGRQRHRDHDQHRSPVCRTRHTPYSEMRWVYPNGAA